MSSDKDRLKPLSFHGHKPEDVLRAFMKVKPEKKGKEDGKQKGAHENVNKA